MVQLRYTSLGLGPLARRSTEPWSVISARTGFQNDLGCGVTPDALASVLMDENWRTEQLQRWEKNRANEVKLDLMFHWYRSIGGLVAACIVWGVVEYFRPPGTGLWKFAVAFLSGTYIAGRMLIWLRLWGAYIERRLTDIEALIGNVRPIYYNTGDLLSFDRNPLYQRLEEIEKTVLRLKGGAEEQAGSR